jgi:hypothetical protein
VRTPEGVIGKLNAVVNARLRAANTQAALAKLGLDARMLSPQEFRSVLADEMRLWQAHAPALITLTIFSRGGRGEKAQPLQANTAFLAPNLSPPRPVIVPWSTLCRAQLGG